MSILKETGDFVSGSQVCANPIASIDIDVGFLPNYVRVWNYLNDCIMEWVYGMPAGYARLFPAVKDGIITTPGLVIGSTPANVANIAFYFGIAGQRYNKAAVAAGTALTATTCAHDDAHAHWACFGFEIGVDGTIHNLDAPANNTGYASEALAIAALPAVTAAHVLMGYITVKIPLGGPDFVGATDSLATAANDVKYYSTSPLGFIQTLGITQLDDSTHRGFRIGAHTQLQVAGQTLYWEARR